MMDTNAEAMPPGMAPTPHITVEMALQPTNESRVITEANEPFRIVHVNDIWCRVCGYDAEEALGKTCKMLQGPGSCRATIAMLRQALLLKRNFAVQLLNYTKGGRPFMNTLQVTPLVDRRGAVTHYLGVVLARFLDDGQVVAPSLQHLAQPVGGWQMGSAAALGGGGGGGGHPAAGPSSIAGKRNSAGSDASTQPWSLVKAEPPGMSALAEDAGSSSSAGRVPPFLTKLTEILTVEPPDVVTFNAEEASFCILNPAKFAKEVLPRYFKHNKLGSFSQQLHTYGFRRKTAASSLDSAVEFYHDQYQGDSVGFLNWVRSGGATSKRTGNPREAAAGAPPQLIDDMIAVHEGTKHLALMFGQVRRPPLCPGAPSLPCTPLYLPPRPAVPPAAPS